jgi:CubicO group peptidase (beta-lactamase class C family)
MKSFAVSATAVAVFPLFSSAIAGSCPPLGAVLPQPQAPSQNAAVKLATQKLKSTIDSNFSSQLNSSAISIIVKSIHEDKPLFTYHFTPPVLSGIGTTSIDENTIFRVGSLSKMFPALAVLQTKSIHTDDSVLEYIPELQGTAASTSAEAIPWEDVTVDSLMTQLSGLATDSKSSLNFSFFNYHHV